MTEIKKAMILTDNVITNVILVLDTDNPANYGAEWLPDSPSNLDRGWYLENGQWVDPNPPPVPEPELTAEQIAAALAV